MASLPSGQQRGLTPEIRAAAARGWRVLPVKARDKNPLVTDWPEKATSDLHQLETWSERFPRCNWGVATGPGSGVFVLDVDGADGVCSLLNFPRLPNTLAVSTGRGTHVYFRWPTGKTIRNSVGKLGKGLDIRAEGGFAVIPPSIHPDGTQYAYSDPETPILDAPRWLIDRLLRATSIPRLVVSASGERISHGQRNSTLASLAGSMRHKGMSAAAIEAALMEENRQRCDPPLPELEVRSVAASIARYSPGTGATEQMQRPILVRLSEIESKPVDWLWEPYLPKGMLALLSGDPGSGKTYLSLAIAAALSKGKIPYSGQNCEPISTLYLSQENSEEHVVRPRFDLLQGDSDRFHVLQGLRDGEGPSLNSVLLSDTKSLEDAILQTSAGLMIVDPVQSYLGAGVDAHRSNETRPVLDGLAHLASKHHLCILLVRHLSKNSGGRAIHRGLGSIDFTGAARTELLAGTAANDPHARAMVQLKSNLGPMGDSLGFNIDADGFAWTGKSDLTDRDLLASDDGSPRQTEISAAVEYLKSELSPGPRLQKELVEEGGFLERTLQRAAIKLNLKKTRDGARGAWLWSLPDK